MTKDVNRDPVKLHGLKRSNSQENISKKNNISTLKSENNSFGTDNKIDVDSNHKRINKLRRAICSGRFKINPSRVAEKFIQFETQLST